jgi:heme exporter protein A
VQRIESVLVQAVSHRFGATPALRDVSTEFHAGTITVLAGPNGAGKSTLLAVLGLLISPARGRVVYAPVGDDRRSVRSQIGWVAHDSLCYRELTGRQNIDLAARLYGIRVESVWQRIAGQAGIERFTDRAVGSLSRGQRQRVALARALVHDPQLVLLDEPWTGLDQASSERLESAVENERERGKIVVIVSHEAALAERLGAIRLVLRGGKIVSDKGMSGAQLGANRGARADFR